MAGKLKVCIIGAEGWSTAIAAAISKNVLKLRDFDRRVQIYVHDDPIGHSLLSDVMNSRHENIKYLPGIKLPHNLIAVNDLLEAAQNADILIFSTPHTFVKSYCNILAGKVKETAFAVSMIKGLMHVEDDKMGLVSEAISDQLVIPCYSMMSAHSSMEMAQGKLCEVTLGCDDAYHAQVLTAVLQTNNCRVISINDVNGVELCGTLMNIIGLAAGFVDGLHLGDNTRVATIHLCLKEMMRFIKTFFPSAKMSTFFETCGVVSSVASTYVDKNVNFAQNFISTRQTFEEMEATYLHGRQLLGPVVAAELNAFLEKELMQHAFPLFTAIHRICQNEAPAELMLDALRNHPDLSSSSMAHLMSKEGATLDERSNLMLDQMADALPKLRSCLDKILVEAGSPNFKNLKIIVDKSPIENEDIPRRLNSEASNIPDEIREGNEAWSQFDKFPIETEDIPKQLSAEASKIRDEIREGNVKVGFQMDAHEDGRHVRLLLEESSEETTTSTAQSGISLRLDKGQFFDSSPQYAINTHISSDNTMNDSSDVLDLSNAETSKLMDEDKLMEQEELTRISEKNKLEPNNVDRDARNVNTQNSLIRSIRQTIAALGNREKMENPVAENRMEDKNLPFARLKADEEMRQAELKAEIRSLNDHMLFDTAESLKQENPVELRLHDDVEAALDDVPVHEQTEGLSSKGSMELKELIQWQKLKTALEEDATKLSILADSDACEDNAKHYERLQEDAELEESAQNVKSCKAENEQGLATVGDRKSNNKVNEANVRHFRDKKTVDAGRHEWDWMLNYKIDTERQAEEQAETDKRDETLSKSDQENLDKLDVQLQEALQQDFEAISASPEDTFNKDLQQDIEAISASPENTFNKDLQQDFEAISASPEDTFNKDLQQDFEAISASPEDTFNKDLKQDIEAISASPEYTFNKDLQQDFKAISARPEYTFNKDLQQDFQAISARPEYTFNKDLQQDFQALSASPEYTFNKDLEAESGNKRITHEPVPPIVPSPRKHYREGTPDIQNQPGTFPPPSRQVKSPSRKERQPHRKIPPVEFGHVHEAEQAEEAITYQLAPEAKKSSKAKPTREPPLERKKVANMPPSKRTHFESEQWDAIDNQSSQVSRSGAKTNSLTRKGKDRQVDYRGRNPFTQDRDIETKIPMDNGLDLDIGKSGLSHQRRKVVVSPPFNPPLNPRVRVPQPPFDVRDHEYHTMVARPSTNHLAPTIRWPLVPKTLNLPIISTMQVKLESLRRQVPNGRRSLLQMPSGMPRTSTLTKILCALQIGLLASYFARPKKD